MKNNGFTLLELLIATTLVGILLTGVMGLTSRYIKSSQHISQTRQDFLNTYTAMHLLERDLNSYYHGLTGTLDKLAFISLRRNALPAQKQSGQVGIIYEIRTKPDSATLFRREKDSFSDEKAHEYPLLTAREISFEYLNERTALLPVWSGSQKNAPVAISLNLTDTAGRQWQRTIPLMVRHNEK